LFFAEKNVSKYCRGGPQWHILVSNYMFTWYGL
jgi:hypothetical protein